jgi:hypothetical protein
MRIFHRVSLLLLFALVTGVILPVPAKAQQTTVSPADSASADALDWLEPRGLSVVDLVGQVPEDQLSGSILVFTEAGVARYVQGSRQGDKVTIEVSLADFQTPLFTEIPCLGRRPIYDEWPVAVPPSEMRVFSAGVDISDQALGTMWYFPAAQAQPIRGSRASGGPAERYAEDQNAPLNRTASGALVIPANMGCKLFFPLGIQNLTAEFVFDYPQQIQVDVLGSQTFTFRSYVGPGGAGRIQSLAQQMADRYDDRNDTFSLTVPAGADYLWLNYPPSPVSAYASATSSLDHNIRLPSSGTYRAVDSNGSKSVDHVVSMGLPLNAQWTDADLAGDSWLQQMNTIKQISAPEYFVPPGVNYDPCMMNGGCSDALLEQIHNMEAQMTLYYYRVRRLQSSSLTMVPLRQVGPNWSTGTQASFSAVVQTSAQPSFAGTAHGADLETASTVQQETLRLPFLVFMAAPKTYPDDSPTDGCPCGWFDGNYRMLDVVPGP